MNIWHPDAIHQQTHTGLRMNGQNDIHRCTWHVTGDNLGEQAPDGSYPKRPTMQQVATYLARVNYDPTLLYDPETGAVIQMLPGDVGGYALEQKGIETNRMGTVHVQIETYFSPGYRGHAVFTDGPLVGMDRLMNWLDQLGIPRIAPLSFTHPTRDSDVWGSASGHFGHCHAPLNIHGDPQAIDIQKILATGAPPPSTNGDEEMLTQKVILLSTGAPLTVGIGPGGQVLFRVGRTGAWVDARGTIKLEYGFDLAPGPNGSAFITAVGTNGNAYMGEIHDGRADWTDTKGVVAVPK